MHTIGCCRFEFAAGDSERFLCCPDQCRLPSLLISVFFARSGRTEGRCWEYDWSTLSAQNPPHAARRHVHGRGMTRRHHPNPAEAHRRWRGERSKPVRLGVRDHHTRSLCAESPAQTEQWCCWLCRRRLIFRSKEIAANSCLLANPSPELRIPKAAAQTRVVSLAGIRLGPWESRHFSKG